MTEWILQHFLWWLCLSSVLSSPFKVAYNVETDVGNKAAMDTPAQEEPKFQFKFLSSWLNKRSFVLARLPSLLWLRFFCGSLDLSSSWGACHSVLLYKAKTVYYPKVEMFAARGIVSWIRLQIYIYENQVFLEKVGRTRVQLAFRGQP